MNARLFSGITMGCGIHTCPRKCHNPRDHKGLACAVRVQIKLPCGHSVSPMCHQSKALDSCAKCKAARQEAELSKLSEEKEAGTSDQPFTPIGPRSPTSPTSPWRGQHITRTTLDRTWRNGQPTENSTNVSPVYRGPRQNTDTNQDGLFGKPKPESGSFYSSRGGFGRGGWRK